MSDDVLLAFDQALLDRNLEHVENHEALAKEFANVSLDLATAIINFAYHKGYVDAEYQCLGYNEEDGLQFFPITEQPALVEIVEARKAAGLSQAKAAQLLYITGNSWAQWERGLAPMMMSLWELFLIKTRNECPILKSNICVPSPEEVKAARENLGLTMREASKHVYCTRSAWNQWEQGRNAMKRSVWELFLLKTTPDHVFSTNSVTTSSDAAALIDV